MDLFIAEICEIKSYSFGFGKLAKFHSVVLWLNALLIPISSTTPTATVSCSALKLFVIVNVRLINQSELLLHLYRAYLSHPLADYDAADWFVKLDCIRCTIKLQALILLTYFCLVQLYSHTFPWISSVDEWWWWLYEALPPVTERSRFGGSLLSRLTYGGA